jgi:hypothetical protein
MAEQWLNRRVRCPGGWICIWLISLLYVRFWQPKLDGTARAGAQRMILSPLWQREQTTQSRRHMADKFWYHCSDLCQSALGSTLGMRCLLKHKWVMGETFDVRSFSPWRRCKRCGAMQCGIYDELRESIAWQTMRERAYDRSMHAQIVRQPMSGFDELAHSLGLRRSRKSDESTGRINRR